MKKTILFTAIFCFTAMVNNQLQAQWVQQVSNHFSTLNSVHCVNDSVCYTVGDLGAGLKTTNGGMVWQDIVWFAGNDLKSVFAKNDTVAFTTGLFFGVTAFLPGMEIWGGPYLPFSTDNLLGRCIFYINNNYGFAVGDSGVVIRSDTGLINTDNWFLQNSGTTQNLYSVHFPSDSIGYAVGDSGTIIKTINGGNNWIQKNAGTVTNFRSVNFINDTTGFVAGYQGLILKTQDGGNSWGVKPSNVINNLNSVYFPSDSIGYIAGDAGVILRTDDAGNTWMTEVTGVPDNLKSVYFTNNYNGYAVGAIGTILKTDNGGIVGVSHAGKENTIVVYPNPTTDNLTIETPDKSTIEILNIEGQIVKTIFSDSKTTSIDLSNLSSGVYIVTVKTDKGIAIKKFIKQ